MPLSISARLVCAARHAYDVTVSGPVATTGDSSRIGLVGQVDGFVAGTDRIDAAFVGEAPDAIVVAFRGTLPPPSPNPGQIILDWANDIDAVLVAAPGLPGKVHQGFLGSLDALWPAVGPAVKARSAASPAKPIYVTGHSKGGPLANLAAMRLRAALPASTPVMVATFAGARSGDDAFAAAYDAAIPLSARYEYADDIVPHLPPSAEFVTMFSSIPQINNTVRNMTQGYASVGELNFIDWDGNPIADTPVLRLERFTHLAKLMVTLGFTTIVTDHSIALGSGYDRAISSMGIVPVDGISHADAEPEKHEIVSLTQHADTEPEKHEIVSLRPEIWGMKVDLNELGRRLWRRFQARRGSGPNSNY